MLVSILFDAVRLGIFGSGDRRTSSGRAVRHAKLSFSASELTTSVMVRRSRWSGRGRGRGL